MRKSKWSLIHRIHVLSDNGHCSLLLELMNKYNKNNTQELSEEEVLEFYNIVLERI